MFRLFFFDSDYPLQAAQLNTPHFLPKILLNAAPSGDPWSEGLIHRRHRHRPRLKSVQTNTTTRLVSGAFMTGVGPH